MTRSKVLVLGLLLVQTVYGQIYGGNPYLNGYRNDQEAFYSDQTRQYADNPYLSHAIQSRQIIPDYMAPEYLPPRQELICSGQQVCVYKNACSNGVFTQGPVSGRQNCDYDTEVCCTYRPPTPPPQKPTPVPSTPCTGSNVACVSPSYCVNGVIKSNGQLKTQSTSGKCYAPEVCCRIPESTVLTRDGYEIRVPENPLPPPTRPTPPPTRPTPPPTRPTPPPTRPRIQPPPVVPTYLPPIRQTPPPRRGEDQLSPPIFPPSNQIDEILPPVKCAAALNCTRVEFCSSTGVITKTPVVLTKEQELFRVPLTDCRDERQGFTGKCCRDPDYVDPWPVSQLGRYDANLFGDTGKYKPNGNNGKPNQPIAQPSIRTGSAILSLPIPAPSKNSITYNYPKPSAGQCVTRNKNAQPRGEGPFDAAFGEYPWQAMVLLESSKSLLCSGAIIAEDVVATSAHCVQGRKPFDIVIKAGEWKLGSDDEPLNFELVRVTKIETHPKFEPSTLSNDMALLRLENKLKIDAHIAPICVDDRDPSPSEECVTTGWGKQALRVHAQGAVMHHSPVSILPPGQCAPGDVCGTPNIDACELDAGSALACGNGNGKYVMRGMYSAESQCGNSVVSFTKPDLQWINSNKGQKSAPLYLPPTY